MQPTAKIWLDGELVDWDQANIHVATHALHYGSAVFEGMRVYETDAGPAAFRLTEHLERLHRSGRLIHLEVPFSVDELRRGCADLVAANDLRECYVRPLAFFGYGKLGLYPLGNPVRVALISWTWDSYLGEEAITRGVRAKIASWRRVGPNVVPHVAKATGIYLNSILARVEAEQGGYEEAILLTHDGYLADGSAENVFVVRGDRISTPPLSTSILPGITRETVMTLARHLGYEVVEEQLIRTDLYLADEAFVTGTAAEVLPLRSVDDFPIGRGSQPVTERLRQAYGDLVRGRLTEFGEWVEPLAALTRDRV